jgi:hypothetical protein
MLLKEVMFVDRNLLASVKKLWCLMINFKICGWNEEFCRAQALCMHITRRFRILRAVTLKMAYGMWHS